MISYFKSLLYFLFFIFITIIQAISKVEKKYHNQQLKKANFVELIAF